MRIVQITPGSGDNFYCENCIRDIAITKELKNRGLDIIMVPLYLPPLLDVGETTKNVPIFFGGINVYLQQKFALFRKTPAWLDNFFNSTALLKWAAKKAGMTTAQELGETTISMLRGEHGRQAKELQKLIDWLKEYSPDIICLSNILLAGLAPQIKEQLNCPIVCLLQDEDGFLDSLPDPLRQQAWEIVQERSRDIDTFVAASAYFANLMQNRLAISKEKMHVVYSGIPIENYQRANTSIQPPTIGFLSRMCYNKGLDILVDAFVKIKKQEPLKNARLHISGGKISSDEPFLNELRRRLAQNNCLSDVEFHPPFDQQSRIEFLHSLSLICVPEKQGEACGLYIIEALAAGVPFLQPNNSVFPELQELSKGGILYQPNDAESLAEKLQELLVDPDRLSSLAQQGRQAAEKHFRIERMAGDLLAIYKNTVSHFRGK